MNAKRKIEEPSGSFSLHKEITLKYAVPLYVTLTYSKFLASAKPSVDSTLS
jgi:hypothetical protein